MRSIIFKGDGEDVILGTDGEDAVIAGLEFAMQYGDKELATEAARLLQHLGVEKVQPTSWRDWEHKKREMKRR